MFVINFKKNYSSISKYHIEHIEIIAIPVFSIIRVECQITSVQCFKCCLIFNLWHVILHAFWIKFMYNLSRITKTENTRRSVIGNCGVCGDIHFHYFDCLYRAPCKWDTYTHTHTHIVQYYFIFVTLLEKYQLLLHARVLTFAIFYREACQIQQYITFQKHVNTTIHFNSNICLLSCYKCYEYISIKQLYFIYYIFYIIF